MHCMLRAETILIMFSLTEMLITIRTAHDHCASLSFKVALVQIYRYSSLAIL